MSYSSCAIFLFSLSPFDVVVCVVLQPYFLFLIVAFFSQASHYSFSFPKDFSLVSVVICCTAWPRSIWWSNVARLWLASLPRPRLHLQSSGTDYMPELIREAVEIWISGALARYPLMCMHVDVWVHLKCLSVPSAQPTGCSFGICCSLWQMGTDLQSSWEYWD